MAMEQPADNDFEEFFRCSSPPENLDSVRAAAKEFVTYHHHNNRPVVLITVRNFDSGPTDTNHRINESIATLLKPSPLCRQEHNRSVCTGPSEAGRLGRPEPPHFSWKNLSL